MNLRPDISQSARRMPAARRAFTLLEMLIVLVIIAIIAGLALPHMRGPSESAAINAACRQLVADFSYARQRAIASRSTVAVVFLSPDIFGTDLLSGGVTPNEAAEIKRLQGGVYTHYALYQYRRVGEQPGVRGSDGYITEWKSLPDKTFIDPDEFNQTSFFRRSPSNPNPKFRFPFSDSPPPQIGVNGLPYIAFDHEGRCITVDRDETGAGSMNGDRYLNVARGAILATRDASGVIVDGGSYEVVEVPPGNATNNVIYVNALTGRAKRLETPLQ
jgi:prepilin-type N-terminal cleavage/methylation domain-containing protein